MIDNNYRNTNLKENITLPCPLKMVWSPAQIPRIELSWFLELGFLEVVMQEVSRKALPGDFFYILFLWRAAAITHTCSFGCFIGFYG